MFAATIVTLFITLLAVLTVQSLSAALTLRHVGRAICYATAAGGALWSVYFYVYTKELSTFVVTTAFVAGALSVRIPAIGAVRVHARYAISAIAFAYALRVVQLHLDVTTSGIYAATGVMMISAAELITGLFGKEMPANLRLLTTLLYVAGVTSGAVALFV